MHGEESTGVTLQTLDHNSFDHGTILAQTPHPGLKLDLSKKLEFVDLLNLITPVGADMLASGIRNRIFVPPLQKLILPPHPRSLIYAPKIKAKDREIDWLNWDAVSIGRRYRALGPLWNSVFLGTKKKVRIKLEGIEEIEMPKAFEQLTSSNSPSSGKDRKGDELPRVKFMSYEALDGKEWPLLFLKHNDSIIIPVKDMAVRISQITIEGMGKRAASLASDILQSRTL